MSSTTSQGLIELDGAADLWSHELGERLSPTARLADGLAPNSAVVYADLARLLADLRHEHAVILTRLKA